MKLEDMTIRQVIDMCYNTKYCKECELRNWCNDHLTVPPTEWDKRGYDQLWLGPITAKEVPDEQQTT